jgi:catechol 2,3-dioxygenase-like lactoylglutathione lyase family enzyme
MTTEVRDVEIDATAASGKFVELGHVNVHSPDQAISLKFYVDALGLTRDPEMFPGTTNMAINVGKNQFHLPTFQAQVLRGHVGLVFPDRARLLESLNAAKPDLADTKFAFSEDDGFIAVTSPTGNRIRGFEPGPQFGDMTLGMPYVQFDVARGTAAGISRFYSELVGVASEVARDGNGDFATVVLGADQRFIFRETDEPIPAFDGHHVQVSHTDLEGLRAKLKPRGLVFDEVPNQFRFKDLIDLDSGEVLFEIDHEVRSTAHPQYKREHYNRTWE